MVATIWVTGVCCHAIRYHRICTDFSCTKHDILLGSFVASIESVAHCEINPDSLISGLSWSVRTFLYGNVRFFERFCTETFEQKSKCSKNKIFHHFNFFPSHVGYFRRKLDPARPQFGVFFSYLELLFLF